MINNVIKPWYAELRRPLARLSVDRHRFEEMAYVERTVAPGIEVWRSTGPVGQQRILPDGCMDLILAEENLLVAGPDTAARVHHDADPGPVTGVRLHAGRGQAAPRGPGRRAA